MTAEIRGVAASAPRPSRRRRFYLVAGVLFLLLGVPPLVVYVDARRDIARELQRVEAEIAEERARLEQVRLPCLRGEPIDDSARARLAPLLAVSARLADPKAFVSQPWDPGSSLPSESRDYLAGNRTLIAPLRSALSCTRLRPPGFAMEATAPDLTAWRRLVNLLVLAACERAEARDDRASAELFLDGARLGLETMRADTEGGPYLDALVGNAYSASCLRFLATLVASGRLQGDLHRELERELELIESGLPTAHESGSSTAWRGAANSASPVTSRAWRTRRSSATTGVWR